MAPVVRLGPPGPLYVPLNGFSGNAYLVLVITFWRSGSNILSTSSLVVGILGLSQLGFWSMLSIKDW